VIYIRIDEVKGTTFGEAPEVIVEEYRIMTQFRFYVEVLPVQDINTKP